MNNYQKVSSAADVTPEVIEAWKNIVPMGSAVGTKTSVFELNVLSGEFEEIDNGPCVPPTRVPIAKYKAWIRKPTRNEMRELTAKQTDPITYTEIVLNTLWLGGDMQIQTEDDALYSVITTVQEVLDIKATEIKKL